MWEPHRVWNLIRPINVSPKYDNEYTCKHVTFQPCTVWYHRGSMICNTFAVRAISSDQYHLHPTRTSKNFVTPTFFLPTHFNPMEQTIWGYNQCNKYHCFQATTIILFLIATVQKYSIYFFAVAIIFCVSTVCIMQKVWYKHLTASQHIVHNIVIIIVILSAFMIKRHADVWWTSAHLLSCASWSQPLLQRLGHHRRCSASRCCTHTGQLRIHRPSLVPLGRCIRG